MSSRLTRWTLRLQEYDFDVIHKPGKDHVDADFVSRYVPDPDATGATDSDPEVAAALIQSQAAVSSVVVAALRAGRDPLLAQRQAAATVASAFSFPASSACVAAVAFRVGIEHCGGRVSGGLTCINGTCSLPH